MRGPYRSCSMLRVPLEKRDRIDRNVLHDVSNIGRTQSHINQNIAQNIAGKHRGRNPLQIFKAHRCLLLVIMRNAHTSDRQVGQAGDRRARISTRYLQRGDALSLVFASALPWKAYIKHRHNLIRSDGMVSMLFLITSWHAACLIADTCRHR